MRSAKENIIQIAMKMFAENGFHKTSTASISQEANISTGLLFYHFNSKERLLDAIMDLILEKLNQIVNIGKGSPIEQLESIIDNFINSLRLDGSFWDLYIMLLYQPDTKHLILERVREHTQNFKQKVYELMVKLERDDPKGISFEFEIYRIGVFASYQSNHSDDFLEKASIRMKEKYL
ncbi:MAG: TetR/AcrR family transcriptional regulator [Chloroflexia bacterium]|nr:TetR/AcrR family transcriptional regulator [Chloroflexia bacterium]